MIATGMTVDEAMATDVGGANRGYKWLSIIPAGGNYNRHQIFKAHMVVKETPRGLKVIKNRHNGLTGVYITWSELDTLDKWVHI